MKAGIIVFCLIVLSHFQINAQGINRINKNGQRSGKWITYEDSTKKAKLFEGRFKNGLAKGVARYYVNGGILERKELSRFGILRTTNYYPNGKIRSKGKARIDNLSDRIHYYYFGCWKYYNEAGKPVKYCYFEKGKMIRSEYVDKSIKTNDSLMYALNNIEKKFETDNSDLLNKINAKQFDIPASEVLKVKLFANDSNSFLQIVKMLNTYRYPTKELVGESSVIPFFIMSYAPASLRQKYEGLMVEAAEKGILEWTTVSRFVDKLKIAQGKAQVFGTQYHYGANWKIIYYPIEDPANLNQRRKQIGLPDFVE